MSFRTPRKTEARMGDFVSNLIPASPCESGRKGTGCACQKWKRRVSMAKKLMIDVDVKSGHYVRINVWTRGGKSLWGTRRPASRTKEALRDLARTIRRLLAQ